MALEIPNKISLVAFGNLFLNDATSRGSLDDRFHQSIAFVLKEGSHGGKIADTAEGWFQYLLNSGAHLLTLVHYSQEGQCNSGSFTYHQNRIQADYPESFQLWGEHERVYEGVVIDSSLKNAGVSLETTKQKFLEILFEMRELVLKRYGGIYSGVFEECLAILKSSSFNKDSPSYSLFPQKGYPHESHQLWNAYKRIMKLFYKESIVEDLYYSHFEKPLEAVMLAVVNSFDPKLI